MKYKSRHFWDLETSPTFWINHDSRLLMRRFEEALRPLGFGVAYLPVVMALEEHGVLLQKDLAKLAHIEQPTMAALLGRMERDGIIIRKPHSTDKRASHIALTVKAKRYLPQAKATMAKIADQATSGLSAREREMFLGFLRQVARKLQVP